MGRLVTVEHPFRRPVIEQICECISMTSVFNQNPSQTEPHKEDYQNLFGRPHTTIVGAQRNQKADNENWTLA